MELRTSTPEEESTRRSTPSTSRSTGSVRQFTHERFTHEHDLGDSWDLEAVAREATGTTHRLPAAPDHDQPVRAFTGLALVAIPKYPSLPSGPPLAAKGVTVVLARISEREHPKGSVSPVHKPDEGRVAPLPLLEEVMRLQRLIGNRAVLASLGAQAALQVGAVDDPLEHEADVVADQVVSHLQRSAELDDLGTEPGKGPVIARLIRRRGTSSSRGIGPAGGTLTRTSRRLDRRIRPGRAAQSGVRGKMEGAFGQTSPKCASSGPTATDLNHRLGARAFTLGKDIFFSGSSPDVATTDGQRLLAHELAHTVQQGAAPEIGRIHRAEDTSRKGQRKRPPKPSQRTEGPRPSPKGKFQRPRRRSTGRRPESSPIDRRREASGPSSPVNLAARRPALGGHIESTWRRSI